MCAMVSLLSVAVTEVESGTQTETGTESGTEDAACSLASAIECLFIFKHHKKYSIPRTRERLGAESREDVHTPTYIQ